MPSFWMAQKSPINNRRGSEQESHAANNGSIPSKEMDATGAPAGPPPGHTISRRPREGSGLSARSLASVIRHTRQSKMSRERMFMLRFTLNKFKYIELTTHAGLQGGDWEMAVMEESVEMPAMDTPAPTANEPAPTANEPAQQMQPKDMPTHHQHLTPTFDITAPADEESALAIEPSLALEFNTLTRVGITGFAQLSRIFNFYLAGLLHRP